MKEIHSNNDHQLEAINSISGREQISFIGASYRKIDKNVIFWWFSSCFFIYDDITVRIDGQQRDQKMCDEIRKRVTLRDCGVVEMVNFWVRGIGEDITS